MILAVPDALVRLLRGQQGLGEGMGEGMGEVIGLADPVPAFDVHCPMMSLPLAFGTTLANIPFGEEAYLQALPDDVERWGKWLAERLADRLAGPSAEAATAGGGKRRPRVGLVLSGGDTSSHVARQLARWQRFGGRLHAAKSA